MTEHAKIGNASITWDDQRLMVENSDFVRCWKRTDCGLVTSLLKHRGVTWVDAGAEDTSCDWHIFHLLTPDTAADLVDVSIDALQEVPLTSPHVRAVLEFTYPDSEMAVRYAVQAFPRADGVRTRLSVRALRPFGREEIPSYLLQSYAESLRLQPARYQRHAVGYYNDLQHRNHDDTPILKEERHAGDLNGGPREVYDWANLLCLEREEGGLVLLKESHKCVNQSGIDTGAFVLREDGVQVTGLGLKGNNYASVESWLPHDRFRPAWANWCVPYDGGEAEKQLAIKRFDRARFQPDPAGDVHSRSNTWGTRRPGEEARAAAEQDNVLREIESSADLGIDAVAIDDGWQYPPAGREGTGEHDWRPHPERFPNGWTAVREAAREAGVAPHLWIPGAQATLEQIIRNVERGGFTGLKIDFLNFPSRDSLEAVVEKIRRLLRHTDHKLRISWDVTENSPRLGYYYARQFGSLHIANRKPTYDTDRVHHIAYTPRLVLRDAWHLAHYLNLNQIEIPVQDVDKVDPVIRNSSAYSHAYCTAMSIVGLPLFFQETHFLEGRARKETRTIMQTWREHREEMARGHVFPIGEEPCGAAWTGFQCHDPETGNGYVMVFRELSAPGAETDLALHFVENQSLAWKDVLSGEQWSDEEATTGSVRCRVEKSPGFRWLLYRGE